MEITQEALPWSSEDESNWNGFLQTNSGRRLLPKLVEGAPALFEAGDVNKILIRSGQLMGFQKAVSDLLALTHTQPVAPATAQSEAYPPLEDDAKWSDGEKLQSPEKK